MQKSSFDLFGIFLSLKDGLIELEISDLGESQMLLSWRRNVFREGLEPYKVRVLFVV